MENDGRESNLRNLGEEGFTGVVDLSKYLDEEKEPAMWRAVTRVCLCVCVFLCVPCVSVHTFVHAWVCLTCTCVSLWMRAYTSM